MGKLANIAVILVTNREVLRFDFGRDYSAPILQIRETADAESSLQDTVSLVIDEQPKLPAKTLVLLSGIWSQIILLPQQVIKDIESSELLEAIKFEAETLSGIDIDEIAIATKELGPLDDQQQYWASAIRQSELDEINRLLKSAGTRLVTIAHPAGLTRRSADDTGSRLEIWSGLAFLFTGKKKSLHFVKQVSSLQDSGKQTEALERVTDIITGPESTSEAVADLTAQVDDLSDSLRLERWIGGVARKFADTSDLGIPVLRVSKVSTAAPLRHLVAVALMIVAIGFCYWHWDQSSQANAELLRSIEFLKQPAIEKQKYDAQINAVTEKISEFETSATSSGDDLKRVQFFLEFQRDRLAKLLDLLVELRTPDLVIEKIGGSEDGVVISGTSLNGEAAQGLAKQLREVSASLGWAVNAAKQEGQQKLTSGGPWTFQISLTDTGPFEAVKTSLRTVQLNGN